MARMLLLLIAMLGWVVAPAGEARAQHALQVLDRAEIVLDDSAEPPPDDAAWQPQALVDHWPSTRPGVFGYAWYRLRWNLVAQPREQQAVMVARLRSIGAIYVNRKLVGQTAEFGQQPGPVEPVFFTFDADLLHVGDNTVHVRLWVSQDWQGRMTPVHVGDKAAMVQAFENERFLGTTLTQMAGVFSRAG